MKNRNRILGLLLATCSLLFIRCTPDVPFISTTKEVIQQGNWAVQYYFDGQDRTALFSGYSIQFKGDGSLEVTKGTDVFTGNWVVIKDGSQKDVLTVNVNQEPSLSMLNDSWNVQSLSLINVGLKDPSNTQLVLKKL